MAIVSLAASGLYFVKPDTISKALGGGGAYADAGHADVGHADVGDTGHGHASAGHHEPKHWTEAMVMSSSVDHFHSPYAEELHRVHGNYGEAQAASGPRGLMKPGSFFGFDPHQVMYYVSAVVGLVGILAAAFFHGPKGLGGLFLGNRTEAGRCRMDALASKLGPLPRWAENKWYVDELYAVLFVTPLRMLSHLFHWVDKFVVDGLVSVWGSVPRWLARGLRPLQSGDLHGYAVGMASGIGVVLLIVLLVARAASAAGGAG